MRQRLLVLNYHQVPELADSLRPDTVDRGVFREQLRTLNRFFNVVDLQDGIDAMRSGALPPRALALTFDDGYRDNHDVALEELLKAKCPATFFLATDYLDGGRMWNDTLLESIRLTKCESIDTSSLDVDGLPANGKLDLATEHKRIVAIRTLIRAVKYLNSDVRQQAVETVSRLCDVELSNTSKMMTSEQVVALSQAGMAIGGHSASHPILLNLSIEEAADDIRRGRDVLTELLGKPPRLFAYPNGKLNEDFTGDHTELLPTLGFDAAFTTHWGYVSSDMPAFELPRVGFGRQLGFKLVLDVLRGFFDRPTNFTTGK